MRYQFRDDTYQGKTICFIKAYNVDSDGLDIAPVDELHEISTKLREQNPDLVVVIMSGHSSIAHSASGDFLGMYLRDNPRARDEYYQWQGAEMAIGK